MPRGLLQGTWRLGLPLVPVELGHAWGCEQCRHGMSLQTGVPARGLQLHGLSPRDFQVCAGDARVQCMSRKFHFSTLELRAGGLHMPRRILPRLPLRRLFCLPCALLGPGARDSAKSTQEQLTASRTPARRHAKTVFVKARSSSKTKSVLTVRWTPIVPGTTTSMHVLGIVLP